MVAALLIKGTERTVQPVSGCIISLAIPDRLSIGAVEYPTVEEYREAVGVIRWSNKLSTGFKPKIRA